MRRLINANALEKWMKRDDWGTPDERWRPESEFGAIIDAQPTVGEWISVRERLPEEDGEYLAGWYGSDEVVLARFTRDCFGMHFRLLDPEKEHRPAFYYEDDEWGTCEWEDIECWMQKPVPPKEAP